MPTGVGSYGYPSERRLRREALALADASLPSRRSVRRPFDTGIADVRGFTTALLSLLRGSPSAGGAYDESIAAQQAADEAALARLADLGPEFAGAATTAGAQGRSSLSRLLEGKAAAGAYSAKQPGIAASRGALAQTGLVNARAEALTERDEAMRPAFFQALQQARQNALALAMSNAQLADADADRALGWFNAQTARMGSSGASGGGKPENFDDLQQIRGAMARRADEMFGQTKEVPNPNYDPFDPVKRNNPPTIDRPSRPTWGSAFRRLRAFSAPELRQLGYSNSRIDKMIRQILVAAGYPAPAPKGTKRAGKPYDWQ